ncbi:hypothetical protein H7J07_06110 [Mycobacterium koreense]|uniref:Uncharacterized protein n=2 Tax=Mycolicibacillus koreensis TaxID=1069220 RepID=A0A7I7SBN0_9MYCO|nr:hypothetical protein [Mycolicibacillus koreensis]MCV7247801.1 hypothetical protein [Mycolicibacillus koreensis]OSC34683.1 hypothetical protein B8W67_05395 [Mycolicibacillus koreensis]BBY54188.1 hypothetical protein MKOR_14390 [Mycolicibacillus koreensis]
MGWIKRTKEMSRLSNWKPKARERAVTLALVAAPLSLVVSLFSLMIMAKAISNIPKPVDTYEAITDTTRVQNFARYSLLLWMGGTSSSSKPLLNRSSAAKSIELSEVPFEVRSIDPSDIERWQGFDAAQWRVTFAVTFVAPGTGAAQINRYAVTVIDRDHNYQLLMWPSIVNVDTVPYKVASAYTVGVGEKSALYNSLKQFAAAYLTSSADSTSLGRFVSSSFRGSAIADTPYSEVEIESIKLAEGSPQVDKAAPGTQVKALVRVKASASIKTWSIMDLALRVSLSDNNVWLVDGIDSPIEWGDVSGE